MPKRQRPSSRVPDEYLADQDQLRPCPIPCSDSASRIGSRARPASEQQEVLQDHSSRLDQPWIAGDRDERVVLAGTPCVLVGAKPCTSISLQRMP